MELDGSQLAAANVAVDERQIVIAGPGSGKTEVVAALIAHLVVDENVDPAEELLVVSFSRAAVHAVDRRLRASGVRDRANVRTLDSLASLLLAEVAEDDGSTVDFDRRIELAARLLKDETWDRLDGLLHVVVDEVQDVVGARADFLAALLRSLPDDAGFSLLGDPAQAIYDFQIDERSPLTTADLLAQVEADERVVVRTLTGQYRARTRDAGRAAALRESVLVTPTSEDDALTDFKDEVVSIGSLEDLAEYLSQWGGTTALLTDTNGQALVVADHLAGLGVRVVLRRPAAERAVAPRVGRAIAGSPRRSLVEEEFLAQLTAVDPGADGPQLWRASRRLAGTRGPALEVNALAAAVMSGAPVPGELLLEDGPAVVVSTVHRAKGLEFENVVLVDFPESRLEPERITGERRRRDYVALTRARSLIARVNGPESWNLTRDRSSGRWFRRGFKAGQVWGVEIRGTDLETGFPPGMDRALTQAVIDVLGVGEPLELVLDRDRSTLDVPVYSLQRDGVEIGTTSQAFGESLAGLVGRARNRRHGHLAWPILTGARVAAIETVCGMPPPDDGTGIGRWGLWFGVKPGGMLRVLWKEPDEA